MSRILFKYRVRFYNATKRHHAVFELEAPTAKDAERDALRNLVDPRDWQHMTTIRNDHL